MTKKELIERINGFGKIIKYRHYDKRYIDASFSDFKQYIESECGFWKKVDDSKKVQGGYSETYSEISRVLNKIANVRNEELSRNVDGVVREMIEVLSDLHRVEIELAYSYSYSISIRFDMCASKDIANYGLRNEYIKAINSENEEQLKLLINLYNGSKSVNSCLNDINRAEFKAAITFLGLETKNIKRNKDEEINTKFDEVESRINELNNRNNEFENEINEHVNSFKKEAEDWLKEKHKQADNLDNLYQTRMSELEKTYDEKLKLEEPVKYWKEESDNMRKQFTQYIIAGVILTAIILLSGYILVSLTYEYAANNTNIERMIPFSFVMIGIVTLLIYLLRTVIKLMVSSKHLEIEYRQKSKFTYFFLTMLKKSDSDIPITDAEQSMIYQTLFTVPDTGLLKGGDSGDFNTLLTTLINKIAR